MKISASLHSLILLMFMLTLNPGVLFAENDSSTPCPSLNSHASSVRADIHLLKTWSGDYPVSELKRLPKDQQNLKSGYLNNAETFAEIWEVFKPEESIPDVDFSKQMVVFSRNTDFYNKTSILKIELENGVAKIIAMETLSAMPIEDKVAMAMTVVEKEGILFILSDDKQIPVKSD